MAEPTKRGSFFDFNVNRTDSSVAFTFSSMHEDLATAFSCKSFGEAMGAVVALRRTSQALHAAAESDRAAETDGLLREVAAIAIQCIWRRCAARAYVSQLKVEKRRKFHLGAERELDEIRLVMVQTAVRRHQAQLVLESKKLERKGSGNPNLGPQEHGEFAQNTAASWIQSQVRRRIVEKETEHLRTPTPGGSRRGSTLSTPLPTSPESRQLQPAREGSSSRPPMAPPTQPVSARPRPTQNRKGVPMPLTGNALGAIFWDASRVLLDPRRPASAQLWGLRLLHATCMQKKKESTAIGNKRQASSNKLIGLPQPPPAAWFPDLPFTLWVQGPLLPVQAESSPDAAAERSGHHSTSSPRGLPQPKPHWAQRAYPDERLRSALNLNPVIASPRKHQNPHGQSMGTYGLVLPALSNAPSFSLVRSPR